MVHDAEVRLSLSVSLLGGPTIPHRCLRIVLRHALAHVIYDAEVRLCLSVSLLGGPTIPHRCLRIVLRHALAHIIHVAEIDLRTRVPLLGGPTIPHRCLRIVLRDALPRAVHIAETVLRIRVSGFSGHAAGNEPGCGCQISLEAVRNINVFRRNGVWSRADHDINEKPKNKFHGDSFFSLFHHSSPVRATRPLDAGSLQHDERVTAWLEPTVKRSSHPSAAVFRAV